MSTQARNQYVRQYGPFRPLSALALQATDSAFAMHPLGVHGLTARKAGRKNAGTPLAGLPLMSPLGLATAISQHPGASLLGVRALTCAPDRRRFLCVPTAAATPDGHRRTGDRPESATPLCAWYLWSAKIQADTHTDCDPTSLQ